MDEIKAILFVEPFVFEVFYDEFEIGQCPTGLNRTDIGGSNLRLGELPNPSVSYLHIYFKLLSNNILGDVESPDSCAGSQI